MVCGAKARGFETDGVCLPENMEAKGRGGAGAMAASVAESKLPLPQGFEECGRNGVGKSDIFLFFN